MPSSVIAGSSYDSLTAVLTIYFVSGRVYQYYAVPERVARALTRAPSRGRYFNAVIRDRYPCQEVTPHALSA